MVLIVLVTPNDLTPGTEKAMNYGRPSGTATPMMDLQVEARPRLTVFKQCGQMVFINEDSEVHSWERLDLLDPASRNLRMDQCLRNR